NNHMKSNTNFKNKPPKHSNHTQSQPNNTQTKSQNLVQIVKNTGGADLRAEGADGCRENR
ncbi:hypothetical protein, partial [Pararhizobium arenae]|uniref:hypothetical protein n=1 Tax=Pararhizobium arenae TaxID=1856850 RepID=UPI001AEC8245